jgi:metallophosphoesterase superfamily enzyme
MTALEKTIERRGIRRLQAERVLSVKLGKQGWPDRLIFMGDGKHIFWEVKRSDSGPLTRAQKVLIPILRARGETVVIGDDAWMMEVFHARAG